MQNHQHQAFHQPLDLGQAPRNVLQERLIMQWLQFYLQVVHQALDL